MAEYSRSIRLDADTVLNNLKLLRKRNQEAVLAHAQMMCKQRIEPYAKEHAPWRDRTGNARRTLNAKAEFDGRIVKKVSISLSHGVWYGYRLETWFNKRYQIIWPTIRDLGPEILASYNGYLNRLKL